MIHRVIVSGCFAVVINQGFLAMAEAFGGSRGMWLIVPLLVFWIITFQQKGMWRDIYESTLKGREEK